MDSCELLIVGGGAAGIAAAKAAALAGVESIVLAEHGSGLGGVLLQCSHNGFGDGLTGPEYISKMLLDFPENVKVLTETTVLKIDREKSAMLSGEGTGLRRLRFEEFILASGCREIAAGELELYGSRPQGVYTAGEAQKLLNLRGKIPEGPAVILGSGDLGLIMSAHLSGAGVKIAALVEKKDHCGGMERNRRGLESYEVPLICGATIDRIYGEKQLEAVGLRYLNTGERKTLNCRSLLIAVGYRPERELLRGLDGVDWIQLCGNCKNIHPRIEGVVAQGKKAGEAAWEKIRGRR